MKRYNLWSRAVAWAILSSWLGLSLAKATPQKITGHVLAVIKSLQPVGTLSETNELHLAISLPLRNQTELSALLKNLYDPASAEFHHFLTPEQFTERFGPTADDYKALRDFAQANHLRIADTHPNRLILDVTGSAADVQRSFHVALHTYHHPTENRTFYAPDSEPSVDVAIPILGISGLDDYSLARPRLTNIRPADNVGTGDSAKTGSGPGGGFMGNDFRAAYVPDTTMTGTGQVVGMLEFDGYSASDISYYETHAGLPAVTLTNVLIDGATGSPSGGGGAVECSLDIEVAIAMAPGMSKMIVYIAPNGRPFEDILNRMATDNLAKQLSCSWYIPGGAMRPTADAIWQQMAVQGQSFFNASGDSDAYTGLISFPGDSPYITQVGGTTLTTSRPGGAWSSETVWNWGIELGASYNGVGSSGGISTQYSIPTWQTNISMAINQGSTTKRNIPDVALTADNVYVRVYNGDENVGGTSCAAPLWAGFAALVNQEAIASGRAPVGFVNPAIDAIASGPGYSAAFHDINTGNNTWSGSPTKFFATNGYDLCTGWGTPAGQALIDALANPEALFIQPVAGFNSAGGVGGPFTITTESLALTNTGSNTLTWALSNIPSWLDVSPTNGTLATNSPSTIVMVNLNAAASNLALGNYSATLWFTNLNDNFGQSRQFNLSIVSPPTVVSQPSGQAVVERASAQFSVSVTGGLPLSYQWQFNGTNLANTGNISGVTTSNLTILAASAANAGSYAVVVTNVAGVTISSNAQLSIVPSAPIVTVAPVGQTVYVGANVRFFVNVIGTTPYNYQWAVNSNNILGATGSTLSLSNVQLNQSGTYSVTVSNSVGATNVSAMLTVDPPPPCAPITNSLVSWWAGESNSLDNLGLNNGIPFNSPTYATGKIGTAFNFNGNQCIVVSDSQSLHITNAITISAWIFPTVSANANSILVKYDGSFPAPDQSSFSFSLTFSNLYLNLNPDGIPSDGVQLTSTNPITYNTWTHVAGTYDGTNIILYINGNLDSTMPYSGGIFPGTDNMAVGANVGGLTGSTAGAFHGLMDEVALYSRALSAFEIQTIYQSSFTGICPIPPAITAQPGNQVGSVGGQAALTAGTLGSQPMSYQWYFNGTNISGATGTSLVLNNLTTNQSGNYSLALSNAAGGPVFSSNATLTIVPAPPCHTAPSNVVSWWSGQSNALDNMGFNNGVPINSAGYAPGETGTAFSFNGSSQCIFVHDSPSLHFTNALTIEAWVFPTQAGNPSSYSIVVKYDGVQGVNQSAFGFSINQNSTIYFIVSRDGRPGDNTQINSTGTIPTNTWTHVACTYDGANLKLYINGNLDTTLAYAGGIYPGTDNMAIGGNVGGEQTNAVAGAFVGRIDEVTMYNRALSGAEINSVYSAGAAGKCPIPATIIAQPANQTAPLHGQAAFNVAATGFSPLTYQWQFKGTNIGGATNTSLTLSNLQFNQAGNYSVLVSNSVGAALSSNALLTVSPLFNFVWNQIASPEIAGVPFAVTITAENPTNSQVASNFTGTVALQTTNGLSVSPPVSGSFSSGVWTGSVTIAQAVTNLVLESSDSSGEIAFANPINVITPPTLTTANSSGTLFLSWSTNSAGFVLQTSPDLSPGSWAPVSTPPLQIGGQYVESIIYSPTNAFYRLIYTGQ